MNKFIYFIFPTRTETNAKTGSWTARIPLLIIMAIAIFTRFHGIDRASLWVDEGVTLAVVRLPFGEHLQHAWDSCLNNQFLYYLLLRPWRLLGESEFVLRSFSAIFSVGGVAVIYALGNRLSGRIAGAVAGLILALHPGVIEYSQQARSYGLAIFLALLSTLFFVRFLEIKTSREAFCWFFVSVLAIYAHFFCVLVIASQVLSLAFVPKEEFRRWKMTSVTLLGIFCLTMPIINYAASVPKDMNRLLISWIPPLDIQWFMTNVTYVAGGSICLVLIFVAIFSYASWEVIKCASVRSRWKFALVLILALLPIFTLTLISILKPILFPRYLLFATPGWALSAGLTFAALIEKSGRWVALAASMLLLVVVINISGLIGQYRSISEDWRTPAYRIASATLPGDVILYNIPWAGLCFEYYFDRMPHRPRMVQEDLLLSGRYDLDKLARYGRVWLVLNRDDIAESRKISVVLARSHPYVTWKEYPGEIRVVLFDTIRRPGIDR